MLAERPNPVRQKAGAEPPVERKLAAILSADVAGYSRMMGADEAGTLALLSAHRGVIDELIRQRNGRIANTAGDSVLAELPSVLEAVQCGVEIQQAVAARGAALPEERRMLFRIGINVGDVMVKDDDLFGDGVNVTARLQGLAAPGGICISRAAGEPDGDRAAGMELAFWDSMKESGNGADYAAYLERYPTGNFAALARARLAALAAGETAGQAGEVKLEITFWESVSGSDDPGMLRAYLEKYPEGHFRALAEARLAQIEG